MTHVQACSHRGEEIFDMEASSNRHVNPVASSLAMAYPRDACKPIASTAIVGRIALVERGDCSFVQKARHVQAAGGIGMIVTNNDDSGLLTMVRCTGHVSSE